MLQGQALENMCLVDAFGGLLRTLGWSSDLVASVRWPPSHQAPRCCSPRPSAAGLNPEPVRQGSELSGRINAVLHQLRSSKELWQVGLGGGGALDNSYGSLEGVM